MTDPTVADAVYLEPLTVPAIEAVIARERPEGLLAGLGGQTALNLAMALSQAGVLARYNVRLLGTPLRAIEMAEDREQFRDLLDRLGQPYAPSAIVEGATDGGARRERRRRPRRDRPAGDHPAGVHARRHRRRHRRDGGRLPRARAGRPAASPIGQVMVEKVLVGWQEIEYEVMRDADDTCIAVCSMENVDPLGVHTGDSIVVAPVQTLPDPVHQRLRSAALAIIRGLGVEGGCNVQFALSPDSRDYAVIEVNPRVSRSSALASKATGYPIARVAAQIAVGRRLAEIPNVVTGTTVAAFEPALDYLVVKLPRFPFDKFPRADRTLGSQMKATGEVMAIDRTFGAALNKALRGLEQAGAGPLAEDPAWAPTLAYLGRGGSRGDPRTRPRPSSAGSARTARPARAPGSPSGAPRRSCCAASSPRPTTGLWRILALLRRGVPETALVEATGINPWFVAELGRSIALEAPDPPAGAAITDAGRPGGDHAPRDRQAGGPRRPRDRRPRRGGGGRGRRGAARRSAWRPGFAMVDTCAAEFAAETPYFYAPTRPPARSRRRRRSRARRPSSSARARSGSGRGSSSTTAPCAPPRASARWAGRR